jgi:hypothetical protein
MTQGSASAEVFVNATHNRLAVIYSRFTPTITVNGEKHRLPWGTHRFEVPQGDCEVSVSYPWLLPECGKNTIRFSAEEGKPKTVTYCARLIRYIPGRIGVK